MPFGTFTCRALSPCKGPRYKGDLDIRPAILLALALACNTSGSSANGGGADGSPDVHVEDAAEDATGVATKDVTGITTEDATVLPPDVSPPPVSAIDCRVEGDGRTTLVFVNGCTSTLGYAGSDIPGGTLAPGAFVCVDIGSATESIASKRYWGWLGADPGAERHTLAEFTFNTSFHDFDWYNISHVDAFNLPMQIVPVDRPDCRTLTCATDFLSNCPSEGQYRDATGQVIACVSPRRDDAQSPVVQYFETCDDAYAWSGDDANGSDPSPMCACAGEDWDIVFCPPQA
jgi:hypothetical protein